MRRSRSVLAAAALFVALAGAGPVVTEPPVPTSAYQFGLLRRGPAWTPGRTPATDSIQAGHMANIHRMASEGALLGAGPILDRGGLRGIFIFRPDSVAKLRSLAARDPAIQSGRLTLELLEWTAPSGIGALYAARSKQPGFRDSMITFQLALLKKGPLWSTARTPERAKILEGHAGRLFRLIGSGELATAGPFGSSDSLAGVCVFRGDSATAQRLASEDPSVKSGHLAVEIHPWLCAYGVMPGDSLP